MPDIQMRLVHYKRIASAKNADTLRDLQVELIDRFGMLPDATKNLFRQTHIRLTASRLGISKIEATAGGITVKFDEKPAVNTHELVALISAQPNRYGFDRQQRFVVRDDLTIEAERFAALEELLSRWQATSDHDVQRASG